MSVSAGIVAPAGAASIAPGAARSMAATATRAHVLDRKHDLGVVAPNSRIHVVVALRGNLAAADALLRRIYRRGDPLYHHFLRPEQFTAMFAPSATSASAVAGYLARNGMRNVTITPNRLLVKADTDAATASRAFATEIHATVQGNRRVYANVRPASVPRELADTVQAVAGLDNFQMHTYNRRMPSTDIKKYFGSGIVKPEPFSKMKSSSGYVPQDCNDDGGVLYGTIYGNLPVSSPIGEPTPVPIPNAPLPFCYPAVFWPNGFRLAYGDNWQYPTASNVSIADFTEGATNLPYGQGSLADVVSDLFQMEDVEGIPQAPVTVVQVGALGTDTSGEGEWDIDSQAAVGITGGVHHYYFYNGTDLSNASMNEMFSQFVTDDVAQVGNASFGECEAEQELSGGFATTDLILAEAALQGQTITASSGDSAAEDCGVENGVPAGAPGVDYPSSSPYALSVGGTSLLASSTDGTYYSETTWCSITCGGGGGISAFEPQSPWQSELETNIAGQGVYAGTRLVPDMAMIADPYTGLVMYVSGQVQAGWGGTSLAAPLAEGVWARMLSARGNALGNAGAALYGPYIAAGGGLADGIGGGGNLTFPPNFPSSLTPTIIGGFNDVFLGTNTVYDATPGFDLNTGMGSFNIGAMYGWSTL